MFSLSSGKHLCFFRGDDLFSMLCRHLNHRSWFHGLSFLLVDLSSSSLMFFERLAINPVLYDRDWRRVRT